MKSQFLSYQKSEIVFGRKETDAPFLNDHTSRSTGSTERRKTERRKSQFEDVITQKPLAFIKQWISNSFLRIQSFISV